MARKSVVISLLIVVVGIGLGVSLYWLCTRNVPSFGGQKVPPTLMGGHRTLRDFALALAPNDPMAPQRVLEIATGLESKQLRPEQVDGVPVMATVIPAWWLSEPDIFEITVLFLGQQDKSYELWMVDNGGRQIPFVPDPASSRLFPLAENIWQGTWRTYVDRTWMAVKNVSSLPSRSDVGSDKAEQDALRGHDVLQRMGTSWKVVINGKSIPMVIGPRIQTARIK